MLVKLILVAHAGAIGACLLMLWFNRGEMRALNSRLRPFESLQHVRGGIAGRLDALESEVYRSPPKRGACRAFETALPALAVTYPVPPARPAMPKIPVGVVASAAIGALAMLLIARGRRA